jgi:uncharacterized RDD family membrane protein YckC
MDTSHDQGAAPGGHAHIAGFWRRLAAMLIDWAILGVPCFAIGYVFLDRAIALGEQGRFIGFCISVTYFGLLNSSLYNGQTLAKWLLGLRVVGASGQPISIARTLPRAVVLSLPFFLNGASPTVFFPEHLHASMMELQVAQILIVFGFGASIGYLYLFNRRTRQSLHDLFVESYVVKAEEAGDVSPRIWQGHVAIVLALIAASLALPTVVPQYLEGTEFAATSDRLGSLRDALLADPSIPASNISLTSETSTFISSKSGSSTSTSLDVIVTLAARPDDTDDVIHRVARAVLRLEPGLLGQKKLRVTVQFGFDLGLAQYTEKNSDIGTPDEWRRKLAPPAEPASTAPTKT